MPGDNTKQDKQLAGETCRRPPVSTAGRFSEIENQLQRDDVQRPSPLITSLACTESDELVAALDAMESAAPLQPGSAAELPALQIP